MKIAIIANNKTEHLNQCLGLREIIQDYKKNANCVTNKKLFKKFMLKLNKFHLTAFFKFSSISKSVILSYFF